jgi:hypothetical protein
VRWGWRRLNATKDGTEYLTPVAVFNSEICPRGHKPKTVLKALIKRGYLLEPREGEPGKWARNERIPGLGAPRFYVFKSKLIDGEGAGIMINIPLLQPGDEALPFVPMLFLRFTQEELKQPRRADETQEQYAKRIEDDKAIIRKLKGEIVKDVMEKTEKTLGDD